MVISGASPPRIRDVKTFDLRSLQMKLLGICLFVAIVVTSALAQTPPTLHIVTEDPNLPSELYYGNIKVKPLRIRPGTNTPLVFEDNDIFVFQHYVDFLARMPDTSGFQDWNNVLNTCTNQGHLGADPACDRVHVSSGFFRSTEFGERGFWVYRFYHSVLGRLPKYIEFRPDLIQLSGIMTPAEEETKRSNYASAFLVLPEFTTKYPGLATPANASQFITALEQTAQVTLPASVPPTQPGQPPQYGRSQLINLMQTGGLSPAQTLRAFIEQKTVWDAFYYRGFVTMEYFGYLRRDPDQAGWDDWVDVLTNGRASAGIQPGDYRHLVFGFIYSVEYRNRF
jgi:hypothetical protein